MPLPIALMPQHGSARLTLLHVCPMITGNALSLVDGSIRQLLTGCCRNSILAGLIVKCRRQANASY
jgi:hypothetical protein